MNFHNTIRAGAAFLAIASAGSALAADAVRSNEVRLGMYFVKFNVKANPLSGDFIPPGYNLNIDNNSVNTPYFAYVRRLTPHFIGQLAAGVPPKTEIVGKGSATVGSAPFNGVVLATARWFSPTVLLNYVFRDESATWRPYLGAGVNFTHFFSRQATAAGQAVLGGPTKISLTNSVGPAVTVGVTWRFQDRWHVYASYDYARVNSDAVTDTAGALRRTSVKFNPYTVVVSVGYAF